MINTEGNFEFQIDPALHQLGKSNVDIPIDPALFELEGLVNDVRRGKVKLDEEHELDGVGLDDDDIDPALREIVNSLTNAQQVGLARRFPVDEAHASRRHLDPT